VSRFRRPATCRRRRCFPRGASCVLVTCGGCSCALVEHDGKRRQPDHDAERARLARRGWSTAKIERALAAKAESASRPVERRGDDGVIAFLQLVGHAVRECGALQVLAHFYKKGSLDAKAVELAAAVSMTLAEFERAPVPEDTLVTIRA
jgi:hypothetical protein